MQTPAFHAQQILHARPIHVSLLTYGTLHFLVDAVGAATVFAILARDQQSALLLAYGLISFASRPLFGLVVDTKGLARDAAIAGTLLVAAGAMLFNTLPYVAVVTLGIGNALFHVGAGSICYRLKPGSAGPTGVFAAPGAIGVFAGTMLGVRALSTPLVIASALVVVAVMSRWLTEPAQTKEPHDTQAPHSDWMLLLVLSAIALLSFAGFAVRFSWQATPSLAAAVVAGISVGRAIGGLLADRFGSRIIALGGLLACIPFLLVGETRIACGIIGVLLMNVSVPVASVAVYSRLRANPAFAFGLVSLALIAGGVPATMGMPALLARREVVLLLLPIALCCLYAVLPASHPVSERGIMKAGNHVNSTFSTLFVFVALALPLRPAVADVAISPINTGSGIGDLLVAIGIVALVAGLAWFGLRAIRSRK